jgi:transcription antitermination protein NusB
MRSRRQAREAALQMLYQMDLSGSGPEDVVRLYWAHLAAEDAGDVAFANDLVRGCGSERDAIDAKIREVSHHWRLERMSRVDRNILRLGAYELLRVSDIPRRVTLNEAVELAKRYGSEGSAGFVNGVLDRIASEVDKE